MFNKKMDWSQELLRCGATGWRVLSREREDNIPERTLPMHYVIPKTVTETEYIKLAESFNRSRAAIWVSFTLQLHPIFDLLCHGLYAYVILLSGSPVILFYTPNTADKTYKQKFLLTGL